MRREEWKRHSALFKAIAHESSSLLEFTRTELRRRAMGFLQAYFRDRREGVPPAVEEHLKLAVHEAAKTSFVEAAFCWSTNALTRTDLVRPSPVVPVAGVVNKDNSQESEELGSSTAVPAEAMAITSVTGSSSIDASTISLGETPIGNVPCWDEE
jgi:hypothetical protein